MLDLDGGYLSRILKRFEASGLLGRRQDPCDGRSSSLHLTASGREAFARLDAGSQAKVADMLSPLDGADRTKLTAALDSVRHLLAEPGRPPSAEIRLRGHAPGDIGWMIERHGALYAAERAWGPAFEALVGQVCCEFLRDFDATKERAWIAERGGDRLGGVFVTNGGEGVAKLRMLLVEPSARGLGLGGRLVEECVGFARASGYREITLWTQSVLDVARMIYAKAGFELVACEPHALFGVPLIGETWSLRL